jgi:hypothetical protein
MALGFNIINQKINLTGFQLCRVCNARRPYIIEAKRLLSSELNREISTLIDRY